VSKVRRNQAARPYQPPSPRRIIAECKRRLWPMRGPRAFEAIAVLVELFPKRQSGVVFIGDLKMAKAMGRCEKTAHRAKYDLLRVGAIRLHGAGPRMCPCGGCGGAKAGGTIFNSNGQPVSAATGYELDPALLVQPRQSPRSPRKPTSYESPAELRLREQNKGRMARALESLRPRAGP